MSRRDRTRQVCRRPGCAVFSHPGQDAHRRHGRASPPRGEARREYGPLTLAGMSQPARACGPLGANATILVRRVKQGLAEARGGGAEEGGEILGGWVVVTGPATGALLTSRWKRCTRSSADVYHRHSHDTYSFGVTESGAQSFTCRQAGHTSTAGMVMAFNPDDPHDGHATTGAGFRYRMIHIGPGLVTECPGGHGQGRILGRPLFTPPPWWTIPRWPGPCAACTAR